MCASIVCALGHSVLVCFLCVGIWRACCSSSWAMFTLSLLGLLRLEVYVEGGGVGKTIIVVCYYYMYTIENALSWLHPALLTCTCMQALICTATCIWCGHTSYVCMQALICTATCIWCGHTSYVCMQALICTATCIWCGHTSYVCMHVCMCCSVLWGGWFDGVCVLSRDSGSCLDSTRPLLTELEYSQVHGVTEWSGG